MGKSHHSLRTYSFLKPTVFRNKYLPSSPLLFTISPWDHQKQYFPASYELQTVVVRWLQRKILKCEKFTGMQNFPFPFASFLNEGGYAARCGVANLGLRREVWNIVSTKDGWEKKAELVVRIAGATETIPARLALVVLHGTNKLVSSYVTFFWLLGDRYLNIIPGTFTLNHYYTQGKWCGLISLCLVSVHLDIFFKKIKESGPTSKTI